MRDECEFHPSKSELYQHRRMGALRLRATTTLEHAVADVENVGEEREDQLVKIRQCGIEFHIWRRIQHSSERGHRNVVYHRQVLVGSLARVINVKSHRCPKIHPKLDETAALNVSCCYVLLFFFQASTVFIRYINLTLNFVFWLPDFILSSDTMRFL